MTFSVSYNGNQSLLKELAQIYGVIDGFLIGQKEGDPLIKFILSCTLKTRNN